jgi:hypothetical protein
MEAFEGGGEGEAILPGEGEFGEDEVGRLLAEGVREAAGSSRTETA